MNKVKIHKSICDGLHEIYQQKNTDYGDSFTKVRNEYSNAILIRLMDKLERLKTLYRANEIKVIDESINDTLIDLANYAILELIERQVESGEKSYD